MYVGVINMGMTACKFYSCLGLFFFSIQFSFYLIRSTKKPGSHKRKKSKSDTEGSLSRHSKKSSRKTKKKKKKKDDEDAGRKKAKCSSSGDSSGDSSSNRDKLGRKRTKSRHKDKKSAKARGRDDDSSSGGSDDGQRKRRTHSRKKRKQDVHKDSESGLNSKKKRKNWKAAGEGSSDGSSADWDSQDVDRHGSGSNERENDCGFFCSSSPHRGLLSAGPLCVVLC